MPTPRGFYRRSYVHPDLQLISGLGPQADYIVKLACTQTLVRHTVDLRIRRPNLFMLASLRRSSIRLSMNVHIRTLSLKTSKMHRADMWDATSESPCDEPINVTNPSKYSNVINTSELLAHKI